MPNERVIIVGCGGLGREVLWAARRAQAQTPDWTAEIVGFTAETAPHGNQSLDGLPFLGLTSKGLLEVSPAAPTHFICAIGDNRARKRLCGILESLGLIPFTVIDPSVAIGPMVEIGYGSYIGAGSIISPSSRIGRHVVINHACSIGHDSNMGDFSQACPGTRISGWVQVGEGALLASNAVAAPKVSIGPWAILGASSMASRDLPAEATAIGIPAKIVFQRPSPPKC
jgi:sugar O-acyltransferase (sialic acid O-acetyltransferase NeuD family)